MRLLVLCLPLAASLAAGCDKNDAMVTYSIRDADPAVPIYNIQTFVIDEEGVAFRSSVAWSEPDTPVVMPHEGAMGFDPTPPPFHLCAVARGETEDILLSVLSPLIEPEAGREISFDMQLELAPDGEIPDPCDGEIPWPDDFVM